MFSTRKSQWSVLLTHFAAALVSGAFFLAPARGAPAPDTKADGKPVPFPDGVTDPDRHTAFVSGEKGGIQAVALGDGKVLWTNADVSGRPWLAAGSRLLALGDRLTVLDTRGGKLLKRCDAPDYPKVEVPDRCTVSVNLWGPRVGGDVLEAKWYAVAAIDRGKGRPFNFQGWTGFNKAVPAGTVKFHLDTGRAEVKTEAKREDVTMGLVPEAAKPDQQLPAGLPEKLKAEWQRYYKDQRGNITVLDGRLVGVDLKVEPAGREYTKTVTLHAWDLKTGAAAEPVELVKDKALAIANVMLTGDRRHAAVQFGTSALTVYSLADGKAVASGVKGVSSPESAFVEGTRIYSAESGGAGGARVLRAIDLKTGKQAWERPIQPRSTVPLPP